MLGTLFTFAGAGAVCLAMIYLALRSNTATLALLIAVWIATAALRDTVDLSVTISGVRVFGMDLICGSLACIGVWRILTTGIQDAVRAIALVLLVWVGLHIAWGAADHGVQTAVNDARDWVYFTSALLYAATVPDGWSRRAWELIAAAGLLLAAIAVPYFVVEGVGSASSVVLRDGELVRATPVVAAGALVILQSVILVPALSWPSARTAPYLALGAADVVLLLQHRTVWVAGLAVSALALFWWLQGRPGRRDLPWALVGTGVVVLACSIALIAAPDHDKSSPSSSTVVLASTSPSGSSSGGGPELEASEVRAPPLGSVVTATGGDSTFSWRVKGWRALLSSHHSPTNLVFGQAAGGSFTRVVDGEEVNVSAHNELVDGYVRFGFLAVLCLVGLAILLWLHRSEVAQRTGVSEHVVVLLILTQVVFSLAYGLDVIQGILAGILLGGVSTAPGRVPIARRLRPGRGVRLGRLNSQP